MSIRPPDRDHRVVNVLLALATANLIAVMVTGGFSLPLGPYRIGLHSTSRSAAFVAVLAIWRVVWMRRGTSTKDDLIAWTKANASHLTLGAIVLVALGLRFWGLNNGLPAMTHSDEQDVVGHTIDMLKRSSLDPQWYHYPTAFMNLLLPSFAVYFVIGVGQGLWHTLADVPADAAGFYLVARAHSALLGTATVWFTYLLCRRAWPELKDARAGLIAAVLVAVSFNSVRSSHEAVTDVPMTAVATLALVAIVAVCQRGLRRDYVAAGLLIGLACSTKYSAAPLAGSLLIAHIWGRWPDRVWSMDAVLGFAAIPAGFFLGSPAILFDWHIFLEHVGWLQSFAGAATPEQAAGRFFEMVSHALGVGFGWPGALLSAAAMAATLYRPRREHIILLAFVVLSLTAITHSTHRWFPRYLVPLYPAVYALGAGLLVTVADWVERRWTLRPIYVTLALVVATIIIAAPQLQSALSYDYLASSQP